MTAAGAFARFKYLYTRIYAKRRGPGPCFHVKCRSGELQQNWCMGSGWSNGQKVWKMVQFVQTSCRESIRHTISTF